MCLLIRASAPKFRRGRAGALTSRRERRKYSGKSLEILFATAWFHISRGSNDHHRHFSLSAFATASPDGSGPTRCCSMKSSLANRDAADKTHQALIGCANRLCLSPLGLPSAPGLLGARRRKPPFRGKDPENKNRNHRVILVGKPLFYSLASPFFLRDNRLSVPPSFNHHIKELPLPTPHIVPPAGKSFPGAKSTRQRRQLHRRQRQLFTPIHGGRKAALTVAVLFLLLLPPTSSVSRSSIETALDAPALLLSGARSLRTGASSAPSGRRVTPQPSSPSAGGQTGEGETETEVVWGVGESASL